MHIKFFTGFEIVFYHNFLLPFQVRTTFFHVVLIMNFFRLPNQYQKWRFPRQNSHLTNRQVYDYRKQGEAYLGTTVSFQKD